MNNNVSEWHNVKPKKWEPWFIIYMDSVTTWEACRPYESHRGFHIPATSHICPFAFNGRKLYATLICLISFDKYFTFLFGIFVQYCIVIQIYSFVCIKFSYLNTNCLKWYEGDILIYKMILVGYFLNGDNGTPQVGFCFPVPHKRNSKEKDNRRTMVVPHKPDPNNVVLCAGVCIRIQTGDFNQKGTMGPRLVGGYC